MASFFSRMIVKGCVNYVYYCYVTYFNVDIYFRIIVERCWEIT